MFSNINPSVYRALGGNRKKLDAMGAPTPDWVYQTRSMVWVFGLGFVITLVLLMALIGLYYLLPTKSGPPIQLHIDQASNVAPTLKPQTQVVDVAEDSAVAVPLSATVGEASADQSPRTEVLAEEPAQPVTHAAAAPHLKSDPMGQSDGNDTVVTSEPVSRGQGPALSRNVSATAAKISPPARGRLVMDGQNTGIAVTIRNGMAYVPAEAVAVRAALNIEITPSGDVTVDGQTVQGPTWMDGDQVMVPIDNLSRAMHRRVQASAGGVYTMDTAGVPVARGQADSAAVPVARSKSDSAAVPVQKGSQDAMVVPVQQDSSDSLPVPVKRARHDEVASIVATTNDAGNGKLTQPAIVTPHVVPVYTPVSNAPIPETFHPVSEGNGEVELTVTNVKMASSFRDTYKPSEGKQFCIVWASLQNLSDMIQLTTGNWELRDQNGNVYRSLDRLSTLNISSMRAAGINYGYLVFEVNLNSQPASLTFSMTNRAPFTLQLHR